MVQIPIDTNDIVITASRAPEEASKSAASLSIVDRERIERIGEPLVPALLRLTPSASVSTSGPAGSLTEVRIRGAEANHTLLFVDGIRVNDPAAGNTPRFELLNADLASRIEVVRGPQSALWGSEAIGGVVAVNGLDGAEPTLAASSEAGSFGFRRASVSGAHEIATASIAAAIGWQRARGIDSFDGQGDRDGYRNLSGRLRASGAVAPEVELGGSALSLNGRSQFDGYQTVFPFEHADTLDNTRNRLNAGAFWAQFGTDASAWRGKVTTSLLGSSNRNFLDQAEINRTRGKRWIIGGQVERQFTTGSIDHLLIGAADHEREEFHARDPFGFADQDRDRAHQALTLEWRAEGGPITGDIAVRRDWFNRFEDATSLRASLLAEMGRGFAIAGSYGEGIAQPTFFDLYGFSPGTFIGNPSLKPEHSKGYEASLRYRGRALAGSITLYRQRLKDEIVETADFTSTLNAPGTSRRSGLEAELAWATTDGIRLTAHYAFLRARQPDDELGHIAEARRPRHSGSIALDGSAGRLTYGAALSYTGSHIDTRDNFPFDRVRLGSYWLAGARVAYAIRPEVELFARISNAFDADYEDVFAYRTEGRGMYAGIRLSPRR